MAQNDSSLTILVGTDPKTMSNFLQTIAAEKNFRYYNIGQFVSRAIIQNETQRNPSIIQDLMKESLLKDIDQQRVIFDNTGILFEFPKILDPLGLLRYLNRIKPILSAWYGKFDQTVLIYAKPGHIEYRRYSISELEGIKIIPFENERLHNEI